MLLARDNRARHLKFLYVITIEMLLIALIVTLAVILPPGTRSQCSPSWQESRNQHQPTDLTSDPATLLHLVEGLQDEQDFERHLDAILIPRAVGTTNHSLVEEYITRTLVDLGWNVEFDAFEEDTPVGIMPFKNIIAHVNPDSPRRAVIACHYETMPTLAGFEGAIDSAVPCAMMLNLASTLSDVVFGQNSINPDLGLTLMFFDGEEAMHHWTSQDSVYGSSHIADDWAVREYWADAGSFCQNDPATFLDRMDFLFLLDLIGTSAPVFQRYTFPINGTFTTNPYYDMMVDVERTLLETFPLITTNPMFTGANSTFSPSDDHNSFLRHNFRRIFYVITRPFPSTWHTINDNRDSLDLDYIRTFNMYLRVWTAQYLQYAGVNKG